MNQPKIPMNAEKITGLIAKGAQSHALTNNDLLHIIELSGAFLNLQTIADYARSQNISYNGAKHHRQVHQLFGVKFIIDNE